ncbi:MAG: Asp23/Gls24 family envelope stress response protein [Candidatus Atribacteria bacterium]|nr:Asp23/Gls24 family envelope stress response protein [Candidatus Atribacteria bacterium]
MAVTENEMKDKKSSTDNQDLELGNITVSKDVVAIIVAMEATKIKGIVGLTAGRKGMSAPILDKNNLTKGVEVIMNQNQKEVAITISLVADYTVGIYQTARETQKNVKKAVETMTGLKVTKVDVNVLDVKFKEDLEKEEAKEEVQVEEKEKPDTQKNKE